MERLDNTTHAYRNNSKKIYYIVCTRVSIACLWSFSTYSGDYIYIIIFRNLLLISSCTHVFNRESQLGVHTVKRQTAGKGKSKLYKAIEK